MDYVMPLTDSTDPRLVGGKSANLGELLKAGVTVPPGFTITTQAFLEQVATEPVAGLIERSLSAIEKGANVEELELVSNEIRRAMQHVGMSEAFAGQLVDTYHALRSPFVAVRSSATVEDGTSAAWAGQLESYLYIENEMKLLDAVINCWASLYSPRALSYRLAQGMLRKPVSVACLVQQMIIADKSGVAFSADPITNNPDICIIEAVWGDCEQLVSGEVTPDSYYFNKKTDLITSMEVSVQDTYQTQQQKLTLPRNLASARKLDDGEVLQLSRLCDRVAEHFGRPQDVEWVYEKRMFYIVQARPITTFKLNI